MNKFRSYILILLCFAFVPSLALGQSPGSKKWTYETEGGQFWGAVNSTATIGSDGTIYFGSDDNNLYAINPDGSKKWNFKTSGDVYSSPAIGSDGTIYVGSRDNNLYAINPEGSKKWAFKTGDDVDSSPAIGSDGTIYVGSGDNNLYAINPDGSKKWAFKTGDDVDSSPAIGRDGTIYVADWDTLYGIKPDGSVRWKFYTENVIGSVDSSPAIGSDGTIYIGTNDGVLQAVNGNNIISHSKIKIKSFNSHAAPFSLTFETESDSTYKIEASYDLKQWGEIGEVQGTGSLVKFTDPRLPIVPFGRNYFRVKLAE